MQSPGGLYNTNVQHQTGYIRPTAIFTDGMFRWLEPATEGAWSIYNGGGGMIGITIADVDPDNSDNRQFAINNGAVYLKNATTCSISNCAFWYLKGSAIRTNQTTICQIDQVQSQRCGDSGKPAFHFGDGEHNAGTWIRRLFSEYQYAAHVKAEVGAGVHLLDSYFEHLISPGFSFCIGIASARGCFFNANTATPLVLTGNFVDISDCTFDSASALQVPFITYSSPGDYGHFSGLRLRQAHANQVNAITCSGQFNRFDDILFSVTGNLDVGQNNIATGLYFINCVTSDTHVLKAGVGSSLVNCNVINAPIDVSGILATDYTRVVGCHVAGISGSGKGIETTSFAATVTGCTVSLASANNNYVLAEGTKQSGNTGLQLLTRSITIPLTAFRKVDSSGDVGNLANIGGLLASDSNPSLLANSNGDMAIQWATGNQDRIAASVMLPVDFYGGADVVVELMVQTNNSGGGGIEAASFDVKTTWNGAAQVSDSVTDSNPATTPHKINCTIAHADIPDTLDGITVTLQLIPQTHTNDPVQLLAVRMRYFDGGIIDPL
jgi:hypothetical protein